MDLHRIRSAGERALVQELELEPRVLRAREALAHQDGPPGTRRHLLARALRLSREVAPDLVMIVEECRVRLEIPTEVELYVFPSADYNAGCARPEKGRVFILVSSALMEGFDADELRFVMGHELGHHLYEHHQMPIGQLLGDDTEPIGASLALKLSAWSRFAEVSADRAGMVCAEGLAPAARALFKLSSGLKTAPDERGVRAYLHQADELYQESEGNQRPSAEWLASHPFSPIRLRAAQAFEGFLREKTSLEAVEREVGHLMAVMEPGYLHEDSPSAEAMRRALYAAGVVLAGVDGEVTREELEALQKLLPGRVGTSVNLDLMRGELQGRLTQVNADAPSWRRAQLVRDLATIARADGLVGADERSFLLKIAQDLGVEAMVVHEALGTRLILD